MTTNLVIEILALLFLKHFIIDFPLQTPYQYLNKGTYGHPGGILHSALHGFGTWLCLFWYTPAAVTMAFVDFIVHYNVDWAKMNINKKLNLGPLSSEKFWWLLGFDQLLHSLTYLAIIYCIL